MTPTHLLDAGACGDYLSGRIAQVQVRILTAPPESLCTSAIVAALLRSRASRRELAHLEAFLDEVPALPFGPEEAARMGELRHSLEPYDALIAAHALALDCVLVTHRAERFRGVSGLALENWREPPED